MPGRFITFEGGEGAGKSTQVQRLERRLRGAGLPVVATREPGGSPRAERIRAALLKGAAKPLGPMAEALLLTAARRDHVEATIRPALRDGAFVLSDRFMDSTRVYQGAIGGLDAGVISALERIAIQGTRPDLTFVLDLPAEIGLARAGARAAARGEGPDRFEREGRRYHEDLRRAFRRLVESEPKRCVLIDAEREPDAIEAEIWLTVAARFPAEIAPPVQDRFDAA